MECKPSMRTQPLSQNQLQERLLMASIVSLDDVNLELKTSYTKVQVNSKLHSPKIIKVEVNNLHPLDCLHSSLYFLTNNLHPSH